MVYSRRWRHANAALAAPNGSLRALDWLNFFLADVQSGLGPFLAIFLISAQHWNAADIGVVMTLGGIATLVAQTPAGALIDVTRRKRLAIMLAALVIAVAAFVVTLGAELRRRRRRADRAGRGGGDFSAGNRRDRARPGRAQAVHAPYGTDAGLQSRRQRCRRRICRRARLFHRHRGRVLGGERVRVAVDPDRDGHRSARHQQRGGARAG